MSYLESYMIVGAALLCFYSFAMFWAHGVHARKGDNHPAALHVGMALLAIAVALFLLLQAYDESPLLGVYFLAGALCGDFIGFCLGWWSSGALDEEKEEEEAGGS